jgi:hypothetical protein
VTLGTGQLPQPPAKDEPAQEAAEEKKPPPKNPFRGSTLIFDQSMSTQTAHLEWGEGQQSYVPSYQWWISVRPRYNFTDRFSVSLRMDYYKEFTNSSETTYYREDQFGDLWASASYSVPLPKSLKNTRANLGARLILPVSKYSQAAGMYVNPGVQATLMQNIPLRDGDDALFSSTHVGVTVIYSHPFYRSTTATPDGFGYIRQDMNGRSVVDPQLEGSMLTSNSLFTVLDTGLQITDKLSFSANMIFINSWKYQPTENVQYQYNPNVSPIAVPRNGDSPRMTERLWFSASVDYELMDELTLSLGYYNLANALGPDGQFRGLWGTNNVWWSPNARVFFDVTANLDKIYDSLTGSKSRDIDPSQRRTRITQNVQKVKLGHVQEANSATPVRY